MVCLGDEANACGGCVELAADVGGNCGACGGSWACSDSREGLVCVGADQNVCGGCGELNAAPGDSCGECGDGKFLCGPDGQLSCDERELNACGGCDELRGTPETPCGVCGAGVWECTEDDNRLRCAEPDARVTNSCGGCLSLATEPGTSCGACGVWTCQGANGLACQENGLVQCGYIDADGDGWGSDETACTCADVTLSPRTGDCDDDDRSEHPTCGDGWVDCGDDVACEFVPEAAAGTVVRPLTGLESNPGTRSPMSAAHDVTGDGYDDLVVAMPHAPCVDGSPGCGTVLVLAGPVSETKLSQPRIDELPEGTTFGDCLSVGDFNSDGVFDVAVLGTDGEDVQAHFFLGPLPDLRYLQASGADYVVEALRRVEPDSQLLACDVIGASLALTFDATPYVQLLTIEGIVDDVDWGPPAERRAVADVVESDGVPVVYVIAYHYDHVDVELWSGFAPFQAPERREVRRILDRACSATIRVRAVEMGDGIGMIIASRETGIGLYRPQEGDWPLFADITILGLRVLPVEGWPLAGGMDLDGNGEPEFAVGNSRAPGSGQVVWGEFREHFSAGWRATIYPGDATVIGGGVESAAFGQWVDARGDLNNDGEFDLVALEGGDQDVAPEAVIFFARQGY